MLGNDNPEGQRGGRDYSRQGILRLRGEVSVGGIRAGDSGEDLTRAEQTDSRDGCGGIQGLRSFRPGARGLPDGAGRQGAHLCERSEHHAGLYADQHVSEAVGGVGAELQRADHAAD